MHSMQKYLLIGPMVLFLAFGVVIYVKRHAAQPRDAAAQLLYAKQVELRLGANPGASKDQWRACIAEYERVFTTWPKSKEVVEAYAAIARIYKRRLKDPEKALAWFTRVTDEFPDSETAEGVRSERKSLAYQYATSDVKLPEFIAALSDYIEHNPEALDLDKALCDRGKAYLELKCPDEAVADFERVLAEFPKGSWADDAVFYLGDAYVVGGDEDKGIEQYEKVIKDYSSSNQIAVAHKRVTRIWEKRLGPRLDEFFKTRYGVERATMFFNPPRPLYDAKSKEEADRVDAALAQTLDLDSAELTVEISGTTLTVSGTLTIKNPSVVEQEENAGEEEDGEAQNADEKKAPTEAKTLWLHLNTGMTLESLTQGEKALDFKQYKDLVEVTLAEPIALDGQTTLAFKVTNGGKDAPGIVIGEEYGHAFADAFWFPTLKLDDAFTSEIVLPRVGGPVESNGWSSGGSGGLGLETSWVAEPMAGRFLLYYGSPTRIHRISRYSGSEDEPAATWRYDAFSPGPSFPGQAPEEGEPGVAAFFDEAVKAVEYLEGVFGTYPYDKIVFAQSPAVKDKVFEYGAGLILINEAVPLESIKPEQICNVLVQQWYGGLVYPISDEMLWYTAGAASYYETLYLAHRYGDEAMAAHWAELRALYDEMFEHIPQRTMAFRNDEESERVFDALVYTKGAWFLRTLRWSLRAADGASAGDGAAADADADSGDEAFVKAQRAFFEKNAFKPVTFRDLRAEFDKAAGGEYEETFGAWLVGASAPSFTVEEWTSTPKNGQFTVSFKLAQSATPKFALPVEVAFEAGTGAPAGSAAGAQRVVEVARITKTTEGEGDSKKDVWHETFTFTLPFDPERIVLDPNEHILLSPGAQRIWPRPGN